MTFANGEQRVAPTEITLPAKLKGWHELTITAPGFRPLVVNTRSVIKGGAGSEDDPRLLRFVLIPEHGPSGTWSEDDVR